jgi:lysophospholipase L1-like esterase
MSRFARAALLFSSTLIGVLACEWVLRLVDYTYVPLDIRLEHPYDQRTQLAFRSSSFVYHPALIWSPRPGQGVFNEETFRGPRLSIPKPADEFRIFTVGDSNTLGWDGPDGANWPRYLGELLAEFGDRYVVENAGVWGYSSFQGLTRLEQCLSLGPDLVLISFGGNDAHAVSVSDREFATNHPDSTATRVLSSWRLGQLLLAACAKVGSGPAAEAEPRRRVPLAEYRSNLALMIERVRAVGAEPILLTRPYIGESHDSLWWKNLGAEYNAATIDIASQNGVAVIDVYTEFKGHVQLFLDESHFTEEGHRLAAASVFHSLLPVLD